MNKPVKYEIFDANDRLRSSGLLGLEVNEETTLVGDIKGMLSVMHLGPGDPVVEVYGKNGLLAADEVIGKRSIKLKIKWAL